jgi:hypothetical protein
MPSRLKRKAHLLNDIKETGVVRGFWQHKCSKTWQAVEGKEHIKYKTTWPIRFLLSQKRFRCFKGFGPNADCLERALDGRTHICIVINDEDRWSTPGRRGLQSEVCRKADAASNQ